MGSPIIKILFIVLNVIYCCLGIAITAVGGVVLASFSAYVEMHNSPVKIAGIVTIILGCSVILISIFGLCGAIFEIKELLIVYSVLVIVIILLELSLGIVVLTNRKRLMNATAGELDYLINVQYDKKNPSAKATKTVDDMQRKLKCCGNHNYTDWKIVFTNYSVPISCCVKEKSGCGDGQLKLATSAIYKKGCVDHLKSASGSLTLLIGVICISAALYQILCVIYALILALSS